MTTAFTIEASGTLPGSDWLVARRAAAAERFAGSALPSADQEVWRYSRIGDLDLTAVAPIAADATPAPVSPAVKDLLGQVGDASVVIVTVDGRVVDTQQVEGSRVVVTTPSDASSALGTALGVETDALIALHDAFCTPVEIQVPANVDAGSIVVIHQASTAGVAGFPRLVVDVAQNARAAVTEIYVSEDDVATLSFPVTELLVARDATLHHGSIQILGNAAWQIGRLASSVEQGGHLRAGTAAFGGDYARLRVDTALVGRGAHGDVYAGYFGTGGQLLDFRTFQDHVAPDTTSNLLFKGALAERSSSVYTGLIKIRPQARGSRAFQTNRNLKLSDEAWAESVPNLEIENNEVQCSHASTVGPVDAEQRFYLESRGVPTDRAERLIVKGVFDEVFVALELGVFDRLVRDRLDRALEAGMAEVSA